MTTGLPGRPPEFRHDIDFETGLRLPDGSEIWPPDTWHGRAVDTAADRQVVLDAIRASAVGLGMDPAELVDRYRWVVREKHTYVTVVCGQRTETELDNPLALSPAEPEPDAIDSLEVN